MASNNIPESKNQLPPQSIGCDVISEPLHSLKISEENESQAESLFAIGGMDDKILGSVSEYDNTSREWTAITPMPRLRTIFGCAVVGHKIYVCGGYDGEREINELRVLDTHTRRWAQLTPMKHSRQNCGVAVLNAQIYVVGGWKDDDRLGVAERYCVQTDRWEDVASMTTKRGGLELVAFNGFLYAIGGEDGTDFLKSVERYDPQTDQWTPMNNTNYKYYLFGSAVLNGNIYIAGDHQCEVYSPADDKWTKMPKPRKCTGGRRLAAYDGKLYAIGGKVPEEGNKGSNTVEIFDFQTRVWQPEPDMDVARWCHGVAVVKAD